MINVVCDSCSKLYSLDPKIIKSKAAKFSCKNCGHINYLAKYLEEPETEDFDQTREQYTGEIKKVPFKERLQVKVNGVLIPLIIVIMAVFTMVNYFSIQKKMETDLNNASQIVTTRLSKYLTEAFWSLDNEILSESLKSEMLDKQIFAINILDRDGEKVYMGFKRDANWDLIENKASIQGDTIKDTKAITKDKDKIGFIEVYFTPKFLKEEFKKSMFNIGFTAIILIFAVSLTANLVVKQIVVTPIAKITELANKISIGNLDTRIPKESKDEIGVLAEAFDRMRISMTFAIKQLRKRQS
ncbi:MAG: HAMP domain-containing protein [Pseudomonadota bacterium]